MKNNWFENSVNIQLCVYMLKHVSVHVCLCVFMYVCACVGRPEVNLGCCSVDTIHYGNLYMCMAYVHVCL